MAVRLDLIFSLLVVSLSALLVNSSSGTGWWALGLSGCAASEGTCQNCATLKNQGILSDEQTEKCTNVDGESSVPAIAQGTRRAILECQSRFDNNRWNCTTFEGNNLFGSFVSDNRTRETAALFGYLTAGATQAVAQACKNQKIPNCPCVTDAKPPIDENIIFHACNDNVEWATGFISEFLATALASVGELCDQWNINVGQKAISTTTESCRCHGMSGTCSIQTCYKKTHALSEIGEGLFNKYQSAVPVGLVNDTLARVGPSALTADPLQPTDFCYVDDSPNFCNADTLRGVLGTAHRLCDITPNSARSCSVLCCDRGHYTRTITVPVEECKFVFCCRIECKIVRNDIKTEYRCNP